MRVYINPTYQGLDRADGGIRRVADAQVKYLPEFGIRIANSPDEADLIINHGASLVERPGVPMVAACHGLMWSDYGFGEWGDKVNSAVIDVLIRAQAITAPSKWVAHAITRGMLAQPTVVYHGVDADAWAHSEACLGYVLWNKARVDPVSDPADMNEVASLLPDVAFVSTFGEMRGNVFLTGAVPYEQMRPIVERAGVYLATARETFGIGTLEALAAGVPVAGWRYGGQEEIIIEGETGYLAEWGDYEGLAECVRRCLAERERLSPNCIADARKRWAWKDKIAQYAALYQDVLAGWQAPRPRVSVVVTAHNLARYLPDALRSVEQQTMRDFECLIVDDASTDDTAEVIKPWTQKHPSFHYLKTPSNLKLSGARNFGWQHAKGKYVIFLDADDKLAPNTLDLLSGALDRDTAIHIAYGHLDTMDEAGEHQQRNPWPPSSFNWHQQLAHLNQLPYAAMMRREVLERSGGYRTRDWRAEDASFWSRVTSFGFRVAKVTEEATLIYRLRSNSKGATERKEHADVDGDWTAWFPWRLAGTAEEGMRAIQGKMQPPTGVVPFGAQGTPPLPLRAWPVPHHQHPAVSIIIPVGPGHAKYLIDALDSVQAQTMPAWECIVVNDSGARLDLAPWPWVRVTYSGTHPDIAHKAGSAWEGNMGLGAGRARNRGLSHARASLVVFLDADDLLPPRALERMLETYVENGGGYVYTDWAHLEDETRWDSPATWEKTPAYDQRTWFQGFQHPVTCLVEAEHALAVGGFDEKLPAWEDWDFYLKLITQGVCPVHLPEPLLLYRLQSGTRRNAAKSQEEQLLAAIYDRYANYISGEEPVMGCCSGSASALAAARTALDDMLGPLMGAEPIEFAPPPAPASVVRMEFIGDEWGAQTWFSQDRQRQYRAGRNHQDRFIDAEAQDVQHLIDLGRFRVVELPPQSEPEPELEPVVALTMPEPVTQRQRGRRARG
jgi:glycosyltransferase involved in cell wall biosynthesis